MLALSPHQNDPAMWRVKPYCLYPTRQYEATNKQLKQGSLVNSLQKLSAFYSQTNPRVSHQSFRFDYQSSLNVLG
jgi:hypothetical protein